MYLDKKDPQLIAIYLQSRGLFNEDETITSAEIAGDGNMNYTIRVATSDRSLILKQARPYVEKYPSIPAPVERGRMEFSFYQVAGTWDKTAEMLPKVIDFDPELHIQVVEDLGFGGDFTKYYRHDKVIPDKCVSELISFLKALHQQSHELTVEENFSNWGMRTLNHFHMYQFPFDENNGLDLDSIQPGLKNLAIQHVYHNMPLKEKIKTLGEMYLAQGNTLLHGDFYPGSWYQTEKGVYVIDPEFCFKGFPEFDLGVMLAHLVLCGMSWEEGILRLEKGYPDQNINLTKSVAAGEVLRRWYGVAQLPLDFTLEQKVEWTGFLTDYLIKTNL